MAVIMMLDEQFVFICCQLPVARLNATDVLTSLTFFVVVVVGREQKVHKRACGQTASP
jgi:hypothetical protein